VPAARIQQAAGPQQTGLGAAGTAGMAGFLHGLFDRFAGFARAFLNPSDQFFLFAFGELEIVIRELGPFLFQLAFGDVPVAFDFKCCHNVTVCCLFLSAAHMAANLFPQLAVIQKLDHGGKSFYGV